MSNRFLIGMGAAFAVIFAGGIAAVMGITSMANRATVSDYSSSLKVEATLAPIAPSGVALTTEAALSGTGLAAAPVVAAATPENSTPVTVADADLLKLASAVKLGSSATGDVSKDVWAAQLPVAQHLLNGLCDCDQRNWLKHFVQAGQEAVAGSSHFPESIQLLGTLRRSNQDLTSTLAQH